MIDQITAAIESEIFRPVKLGKILMPRRAVDPFDPGRIELDLKIRKHNAEIDYKRALKLEARRARRSPATK